MTNNAAPPLALVGANAPPTLTVVQRSHAHAFRDTTVRVSRSLSKYPLAQGTTTRRDLLSLIVEACIEKWPETKPALEAISREYATAAFFSLKNAITELGLPYVATFDALKIGSFIDAPQPATTEDLANASSR